MNAPFNPSPLTRNETGSSPSMRVRGTSSPGSIPNFS